MPKKKAASKKKVSKKPTNRNSRKAATARPSAKKASKKATKKKVTRKKVAKKATRTTTKKTARKKAVSKKKAVTKKKAASSKKAGKKSSAAGKKTSRKSGSSAKRKDSRKKVTSRKSTTKSTSKKKTKKKAASTTRSRTSSKKTTASRAARPASKKAGAKTATKKRTTAKTSSRRGNVLTGPVPGFQPYQPARNEDYMNDTQLEHFRDILLAWKRELMEEVDRTMHHMKDDASNPPDPNDRATQETEFGLELRTRDRERKLLKKIEQALNRIDEGSYGYCEETGDEIGLRRLEARPVATLCVEAQERRELAEKQFRDREDYYR